MHNPRGLGARCVRVFYESRDEPHGHADVDLLGRLVLEDVDPRAPAPAANVGHFAMCLFASLNMVHSLFLSLFCLKTEMAPAVFALLSEDELHLIEQVVYMKYLHLLRRPVEYQLRFASVNPHRSKETEGPWGCSVLHGGPVHSCLKTCSEPAQRAEGGAAVAMDE